MLKSTEIVIEQLIIGLLFIVILALFIWGDVPLVVNKGDNNWNAFLLGVLVIIAAYASGIVVDRWSDTLLEDLESHNRIKVYLKTVTYTQLAASNTNLLPEEQYLRLDIIRKGEGVADHHDYLRTRMRITRAITCLLPALFLALFLLDIDPNCEYESIRRAFGIGTFFFYAAVLVLNILLPKKFRAPKTYDTIKLLHYVDERRSKDFVKNNKIAIKNHPLDFTNPTTFCLILFAILEIVLVRFFFPIQTNTVKILLYSVGNVIVTWLVGWAWWRISRTFFTLVRNYHRFGIS